MALLAGATRQVLRPGAPPPPASPSPTYWYRTTGAGVELNGNCLDPAHGLVAGAAARIVRGCRLVVAVKSRLAVAVAASAGCAAHAGKSRSH
jgi:hypothetical protein